MAHHIFQLETELQNIPEAAPKQVEVKILVADIQTILAADKGEALTQFQDQRA